MTKYVYFFGGGHAEGSSVMRNLLGGKGCELAEMTNLGIPVPPGFTVTTQAWAHYNRSGHEWPDELWTRRSRTSTGSRAPSMQASAIPGGRSWSPFDLAPACRCPG